MENLPWDIPATTSVQKVVFAKGRAVPDGSQEDLPEIVTPFGQFGLDVVAAASSGQGRSDAAPEPRRVLRCPGITDSVKAVFRALLQQPTPS